MTTQIYSNCPVFENNYFMLRQTIMADKADLFKVYSDKKAVPFFNSDNCDGDTFFYDTLAKMEQAISDWNLEYKNYGFVRFSIINKFTEEIIGTIEVFHRYSEIDMFNNYLILRMDLRSDFERSDVVMKLLRLIVDPLQTIFKCDNIASKVVPLNTERKKAFQEFGFSEVNKPLIGNDSKEYFHYFVLNK
ncbi:GNAT family N-acetyltransferase [Leuconostoc falkenbergense]|uniref:GNAT family N-acetyltransferase n=1 Tax=Leuconostoc falkenbergense TaxID=2766470 RepID=UPI003896C2F9